jgi:hypothetical protein
LARLLLTDQRERGTRRGRRALGVFSHAVLVLRWFRDGTPVARPVGFQNWVTGADLRFRLRVRIR